MTTTTSLTAATTTRRPSVRRPAAVISAATLQLLLAGAFAGLPLAGSTDTARTVLLVAAALSLSTLALLNLRGQQIGRMLSWLALPTIVAASLVVHPTHDSALTGTAALLAATLLTGPSAADYFTTEPIEYLDI